MAAETGKTREQVSGLRMAAQATGQDFAKLAEATDLSSDALAVYNDFALRFGSDVGPAASAAAAAWSQDLAQLSTVVDGATDALSALGAESGIVDTFSRGLAGTTSGLGAAVRNTTTALAFSATGWIALYEAMSGDVEGYAIAQKAAQQLLAEYTGADGIIEATRKAMADFNGLDEALDEARKSTDALIRPTKKLTSALADQHKVKVDLAALDAADAAKRQEELDARKDAELRANAAIYEENRLTAIAAAEDRRTRDANEIEETEAKEIAKQDAQKETMRSVGEQALAVGQAATDLVSGVLDDQIRMWANMGEMGRKEAMKLWIVQKALSIGMATANTAVGVTAALASPAGPPASIALAITTGVLGGIQIAAIAAQQPSFHAGSRASDLAPDERTAKITRSETVLTQQGMQALAAGANAGALGGGGAVTIQVGHDLFDAVLRDVDRPGSRWASATGRSRVGHRLRRAR